MQKKGFFQIQIWNLPNMHGEAKVTLWGAEKLYQIYVTHARQSSDWGQSKFPKSFTQAQILRRVHKEHTPLCFLSLEIAVPQLGWLPCILLHPYTANQVTRVPIEQATSYSLLNLHTVLISSLLKGVHTTFFQVIDLIYIPSTHFWKTLVISNRTN